jgi:predicted nucleic acid-binding protein
LRKVRTFVDSGVLIAAGTGKHPHGPVALAVLGDPNRVFTSSQFVMLEVFPKAVYFKNLKEQAFYESFFQRVKYWPRTLERILGEGFEQAKRYGLNGMDALHVAAALLTKSDLLITSEKPGQTIFRTRSIKVISLYSL